IPLEMRRSSIGGSLLQLTSKFWRCPFPMNLLFVAAEVTGRIRLSTNSFRLVTSAATGFRGSTRENGFRGNLSLWRPPPIHHLVSCEGSTEKTPFHCQKSCILSVLSCSTA